jgi:homogentisate 1,2-dioxygenase
MVRSRASFVVQRGTTRVVFGTGRAERLHDEVAALGARRVLVIATPGREAEARAIASRLGERGAGVLAIAREHVPAEVVETGRAEVLRTNADALLAFGGGSAIGLAKALALGEGSTLRIIAVPTTYSGSEMTPIYGITENGQKRTGKDERARPALVVYDPALTNGLPRDTTVSSLWNAMAHAVEVLWVDGTDRATRLAAEAALRLLASSVARLARDPDDTGAREEALEGAYLAGAAFADAGGGLHHKLCHLLGGMFGLAHAATHAQLLPHVVRFHEALAPLAMEAIGRALGAIDPARALLDLARATHVQPGLGALGLPREGTAGVIDAVLAAPPSYLPALDRSALETLLDQAFDAAPERALAPPVRAPAKLHGSAGFGSHHEAELLPGALPRTQNTPRPAPLGLYPELLSGTPFTVKNAESSRVWMYRIRPSFSHGPLRPVASPRFACALGDVEPNRTRWKPIPMPEAPARVDLLDGLVTLGGAGDPTSGAGYAVHLYAANADMADRSFSNADGDLLFVPQEGTLDVRTELGFLRAAPGSIIHIPRGMKLSVGLPDGSARGWVLEVFGSKLRLPERGPIGSNGLADTRHFIAPTPAYEDRLCPGGFEIVHKLGGRIFSATQEHSPYDVVAWQGNHVPTSYDLMLFNAMGSATFDHPDPSLHTVLTAPLDDHGRSVADFVLFRGRWDVAEHSFRPPFMHRNAASEINGVVCTPSPSGGYDPGCTFISPLLTSHGISTKSYDDVLSLPDGVGEGPQRLPDESIWIMFESALPFRSSTWARETPLVDRAFLSLFEGMRSRFVP